MKLSSILVWVVLAVSATAAELPSAAARDQITTLRRELARHDELYHRKNAPEISDAEYDRLKERLAALERANPDAARGVPRLAEWGDDRSGLFRTQPHATPMMSLAKGYTPAELRAYYARLAKAVGRDDLDFVIEPKYDGLAISVTFVHGKLVQALSRGNGAEGDDLTANVAQIAGFPHALREPGERGAGIPDRIEIRGEVYVPHSEFERINRERAKAGEPRFANARALAAGTMRQVDSHEVARRGLRIVFFAIGACEPGAMRPPDQQEVRTTLGKWGLPVVSRAWSARGVDELLQTVEEVGRARNTLAFPTDGAVIKLDSGALQRVVGTGEAAPRWALAYKFMPERVETELRGITLQVGRTGVLTPVAELVPVKLAGSRVSRATLHNRGEIARKDIRVGDFVYLEKAGDVIPAVVGVNLERRSAAAQPFEFPLACPACSALLSRSEVDVAVHCPDAACPAQVRRRLEHFASKACLAIEGLGPVMIEQLVANGWVKDFPDLYRLRRDKLLTLGKNNAKSVDRLLAAIDRSKRAELWRVINGMGLPQVGAATAKELALKCGSLAGLAERGPKTAAVLAQPRYQRLIAELISVGFSPAKPITPRTVSASAPLAGKLFVLTGRLPHLTRAQATARIEAAGGRIASALSGSTHFAVAGEDTGAKLARARELGVTILDEAALLRMLDAQ